MNIRFLDMDLTIVNRDKVKIYDNKVEIKTEEYTDLWQRTYYGFRNDNSNMIQSKIKDKYFSFVVRTEFDTKCSYDQCGIIIYIDSDNWFKSSLEYENDIFQRLGSVVTNNGYSDWATTDIDANIKSMWYRLSRRDSDFLIEHSIDGVHFKQMRIFHLFKSENIEYLPFGIYAASPEKSSFNAIFSDMFITDCVWQEHH